MVGRAQKQQMHCLAQWVHGEEGKKRQENALKRKKFELNFSLFLRPKSATTEETLA